MKAPEFCEACASAPDALISAAAFGGQYQRHARASRLARVQSGALLRRFLRGGGDGVGSLGTLAPAAVVGQSAGRHYRSARTGGAAAIANLFVHLAQPRPSQSRSPGHHTVPRLGCLQTLSAQRPTNAQEASRTERAAENSGAEGVQMASTMGPAGRRSLHQRHLHSGGRALSLKL